MPKFIDLTGLTIGNWTVLHRIPGIRQTKWRCRCKCDTEHDVQAGHLSNGSSTGCRVCSNRPVKHGQASGNGRYSKKYRTWRYMMSRCTCPGNDDYDRYKGLMCKAWLDFRNFDRDMIDPPSDDLTIERIDNSKGYEPGNCRWATFTEQHRNQSNNRWIEYRGERKLLTDWANELCISTSLLSARIERVGLESALNWPAWRRSKPTIF